MIGNKVIIIGCPGSGKSTFARKLRDKTGLPVFYLDMLFHKADRTTVCREVFDAGLRELMDLPAWIIDGNYQRTLAHRFEECTDVFLFDLPLQQCLEGAASRIGKTREDMPWVESSFDEAFRQYILDFPKDQLPAIYELIDQYRSSRNITVFHTREESETWLSLI